MSKRITLSLVILLISSVLSAASAMDACNSDILKNTETIPDSSFRSPSTKSLAQAAHKARYSSTSDEAWCPYRPFSSLPDEYIEIDFGEPFNLVSMLILLKESRSEETFPNFIIMYRRELEGPWFQYSDSHGNCTITKPSSANLETFKPFDPTFVARIVRVYPFTDSGKSDTCLMLNFFGCPTQIVEYILPQTGMDNFDSILTQQLRDISYDSGHILMNQNIDHLNRLDNICQVKKSNDNLLTIKDVTYQRYGMGQLTNRYIEEDKTEDYSEFVGWHHYRDREALHLIFRLNGVYQVDKISIHFSYPDPFRNINYPYELSAMVYANSHISLKDLFSSNKEHYTVMESYFQNSNWFDLRGGKSHIGQIVVVKIVTRKGWTLIDEVHFETVKSAIVNEPSTEPPKEMVADVGMLSDTQNYPDIPTEPKESLVTAPFGQFAITAIMIICGFGIFLILSTIFACFMIRGRRSSYKPNNNSSDLTNCDSFNKLNTSQLVHQNQLMNFSDLQLLNNQQQSLMGISQGTGSTTLTNSSIIDNSNFMGQDAGKNYLTLSPQQQHLMMLMSTNQLNPFQNKMQDSHQVDSSSTLYASIKGDSGDSFEESQLRFCGTMSPNNMRSASNMPLPNPPSTNTGHGYNTQTMNPNISTSLAQAQMLSQGNFPILPNQQNMMTMNPMNMPNIFTIPLGNSQPPSIQPPPQPYFSYLQSVVGDQNRAHEDGPHS